MFGLHTKKTYINITIRITDTTYNLKENPYSFITRQINMDPTMEMRVKSFMDFPWYFGYKNRLLEFVPLSFTVLLP
jgi:hypothetical protein